MQNIRHFSRYTPDELFLGAGIIYLISEDGRDWFECQKSFSDETVKVLYNDDGLITAISRVAGHLYPEGYSVAEVEALPAGCDILTSPGCWKYDNGEVLPVPEGWQQKATTERSRRLTAAEKQTSNLKTELTLGIISDSDRETLTQWMLYVRALNAMDFSAVCDEATFSAIEWPEAPVQA